MSDDMLGALVRMLVGLPGAFGALYDLLEKLSGGDREEWFRALKRFLRKENPWVSLRLVAEGIAVVTESFTKGSFFGTNSSPKLYLWDDFNRWVLFEIPKTIPAIGTSLRKTEIMNAIPHPKMLVALGHPKPFTPTEFAAVIRDLILKHNGQPSILLTDGYANIFCVELENGGLVAVFVHWNSGWHFNAADLLGQWRCGSCVFSHS